MRTLSFLLYINELSKVCELNKVSMFVDDSTIYSASKQNTGFFYNEVKEQIDDLRTISSQIMTKMKLNENRNA